MEDHLDLAMSVASHAGDSHQPEIFIVEQVKSMHPLSWLPLAVARIAPLTDAAAGPYSLQLLRE